MAEPEFISLILLIQHPDKYHEQVVRIIGVGAFGLERKAVYISRDDLDNAVTKNAIWLDIESSAESKALNQKYVLVEGTFDKNNHGHLKLYSGAITKVTRLELWSNPK